MTIEELKNNIKKFIKENGNQEITGQILQNVLVNMIDAASQKFEQPIFVIVSELPTEDIKRNVVYLIVTSNSEDSTDIFTEYIYVNGQWEKLGEFKADIATAEAERNAAEQERQENETTRVSAETERVVAELSRQRAEAKREQAAKDNKDANDAAVAAAFAAAAAVDTAISEANTAASAANTATGRANAEEGKRAEAESLRAEAEATRSREEGIRQESETERVRKETAREAKETTRQTAEAERVKADKERTESVATAISGCTSAAKEANDAAATATAAADKANTAATEAEKVNVTLGGSVISVTNRDGVTKTVDVVNTDETVNVTITSSVSSINVSGVKINVFINNGKTPQTYTTNSEGKVSFVVNRGNYYQITFTEYGNAQPIAPVGFTAVLATRNIDVEYKPYDEESMENVVVTVTKYTDGTGAAYEGVPVVVTVDSKNTTYNADSKGQVSLYVPYGKEFTVNVENQDGYSVSLNRNTRTYTASVPQRLIDYKMYQFRAGIFIVDGNLNEYYLEEWQAAGKTAEEAVAIKVSVRYVDDFVAIHTDRNALHVTLQWAREYLRTRLGLTLHPRKVSLQRASSGVRFTGVMIRPYRTLPSSRTTEHLFGVIDEFGECAKLSAEDLTRYANRINSLLGLIAYRTSYNIRRKTWYMMPHKEMVYCVNMKKIKIKNKYKLKK